MMMTMTTNGGAVAVGSGSDPSCLSCF